MNIKRLGSLIKITLLLSLSIVIMAIALSSISLAQEPSPFEIKVIPAADFAVSGEYFTYTVVITNVSKMPIQEYVFVNMVIPTGTTYSDTLYANVDWAVYKPKPGQTGNVQWLTITPVEPDETVSFDLILNVLPDFSQALVNQNYNISIGDTENPVTTGPDVITTVLFPTPTPTLTPITSAKNTVAPAAISTPTVVPVTATASPASALNNSTTPENLSESSQPQAIGQRTPVVYVLSIFIIVLVMLGTYFFLRK